MSVSLLMDLLINKQQGRKKNPLSCIGEKPVVALALTSALLASQASAVVPVVESKPTIGSYSSERPLPTPSAPEVPADEGTAYMLQTIDQLRSEMMGLRGQIEEQAYQIKQLQQESRDRYLDLDERVSRLSGSSVPASQASAASSEQQSAVNDKLAAEEQAYEHAFQLIRDKRFDDAKKALNQQLADFPKGDYSDNAQYWLGEVHMAQGQYSDAQKAFLAVLSDYPKSAKIPDATYKLGRLADVQGDKKKAREYLQSVMKKYPESAAARLSDTYLQRLTGS